MKATKFNLISLICYSFAAGAWLMENSWAIDFKIGCMIFCVIMTIRSMWLVEQTEMIKAATAALKNR